MLSKRHAAIRLFARLVSINTPLYKVCLLMRSGQSAIAGQCPVCDHSPLTPALCKPSKAVRTTAKAYLKTAEKKLADERLKTEAAAVSAVVLAPSEQRATCGQDGERLEGVSSVSLVEPDVTRVEGVQDIADQPQPSIEVGQGQWL